MKRVLVLAAALVLAFGAHAAKAAELVGKWHFVLDTPGGDRESDANFTLDGEQVGGKWADTAEVKGTYKEGKLDLSFPFSSDEGGAGTLKITGELTETGISGNWAFEEYNGTFKATKKE